MSIDQAPAKLKSAKQTPATTARRNIPATRGSAAVTRQFSLKNLLVEIAEPLALIQRLTPHYEKWHQGGRCVALARKVSPFIPSTKELWAAEWIIIAAANKPLDDHSAAIMLTMLLDAVGKRPPTGGAATTKLKLMLGAVADLGDPVATMLGLNDDDRRLDGLPDDRMNRPVSPVVLALAVKKLIAHQIFELTPAELRKACLDAYHSIQRTTYRLEYFRRARKEIDHMLLRDGTEVEKAAARKSLGLDDDGEGE